MSANAFAAPADELQDLFKEGVKLLRQKQHAKALEKFKAILREDPANDEVYKIWRDSEESVWLKLLVKRGEYEKVAKAFLEKASIERKRRMADAELIGGLVEKVVSDDYSTRRAATIKLAADHGEYAIPALLTHLGNADEEDNQLYAMTAIVDMGPQAVLPLLAALETDNVLLRRNIVLALRKLQDPRALPELKLLAGTDSNPVVKKMANAAIVTLGSTDKSAEELFVARATEFRTNPEAMCQHEQRDVVWHWADGKLASRKTVNNVFSLEVARQSAYRALNANPGSKAAKVEVVLSYLAERATVAEMLALGNADETVVELNNHLLKSDLVISAAGLDVVRSAAINAIKADSPSLCRMAFGSLAMLETVDTLKDSPLGSALDSTNAMIRTEAALTLAKLDPQGVTAPTAKVASLLADAATMRLVRMVHYVGLKDDARNVAEASANAKEMSVVLSATGAEGLNHAYEAPVDLFVINSILPDMTAIQFINYIKKDSRTQGAKVIVVAQDMKQAKSDLGKKADSFIQEASAKKLPAQIMEVLKDHDFDLGRKRAVALAKAASSALAGLNAGKYDLASLEDKLIDAASHEENKVVDGALTVLGRTGSARCADGLAALISSDRPLEIKIDAAKALSRVIARTGTISTKALESLWAIAGGDADLKLRTAVASALGQAKLDAAKRAELLKLLRL